MFIFFVLKGLLLSYVPELLLFGTTQLARIRTRSGGIVYLYFSSEIAHFVVDEEIMTL